MQLEQGYTDVGEDYKGKIWHGSIGVAVVLELFLLWWVGGLTESWQFLFLVTH